MSSDVIRARSLPQPFESVLERSAAVRGGEATSADALRDLALGHVLERLTHGPDDEDLAARFRTPLSDVAAVRYRQDVFRALDHHEVGSVILGLVDALRRSSDAGRGAAGSHDALQRLRLHLNAVLRYVDAVAAAAAELPAALDAVDARSDALRGFGEHLTTLHTNEGFRRLEDRATALDAEWRAATFDVLLDGSRVTVGPFDGESDLGAEIADVFDRFRQGATRDYRAKLPVTGFDHVQGWTLENVARLRPAHFERLERFAVETASFADPVVLRFAHEIRFYTAYLEHIDPVRRAGLPFCYPTVSDSSHELRAVSTFDLALARTLPPGTPVVTNDLELTGSERILVISGPNQGGKSTIARAFGQLLHLAAIGCPVPGRMVHVPLVDQVLTQFEREEALDNPEGRLGTEIHRIHELLEQATARSAIVLNEIFTSTTRADAEALSREVFGRITELDALAVCVTFLDELSRLNSKTVSMVSEIDPADPALRTFRVVRRAADGRAYAMALAAKHGLRRDDILARFASREAQR